MKQELILLLIAIILIYIYTQQTAQQKELEQVEHLTENCKYPLLSNGVCWETWDQLFKK